MLAPCQDMPLVCLWRPANVAAIREAGFRVLKRHPKYSPDLNAIERWWALLRLRLEQTAPTSMESRVIFLQRLRRTVTWMNAHRRREGRVLCHNQKQRAKDIRALKGAKSRW